MPAPAACAGRGLQSVWTLPDCSGSCVRSTPAGAAACPMVVAQIPNNGPTTSDNDKIRGVLPGAPPAGGPGPRIRPQVPRTKGLGGCGSIPFALARVAAELDCFVGDPGPLLNVQYRINAHV
jgi:hypothetical protein